MKRAFRVGLLAAILCMVWVSVAGAAPLQWNWLLPPDTPLNEHVSAAYGNGLFVTSKGYGSMDWYTSPDGVTWLHREPSVGMRLSLFYRNGRWFAGSNHGIGNEILFSDDGITWQHGVELGSSTNVLGMAYGHGRYVIGLYNGGNILVLDKDLKPVPGNQPLRNHGPVADVAFGKGLFVAVSGVASSAILTSPDGLTWTESLTIDDPPGPPGLLGVAYGGGRFVAVGGSQGGSGLIYTSTDGKTWGQVSTQSAGLQKVIYGGGRFLAWGESNILTSEDGVTWTSEINPAHGATFVYGQGRFFAVTAGQTVMTAIACGTRFPDVAPEHAACDGVEALARRGIVSGYPDGTFRPAASVTRAEVTKMLVLALGLTPDPTATLPFSDTAGHWAARDGYLQAAVAAGLITGFPDGTFRPDDPVTRAQLTKMVAAAAGLHATDGPSYDDVAASAWYAGWVAAAKGDDLTGAGGYHPLWTGRLLQPDSPANRGDAATLLDTLVNR